jgi:aldehyde dehydrogenase (NAD+)
VNYNSVTKWAKDEYPPFSLVFSPMKPRTTKEPKGSVLVIAPFNYPVWLAIGPMVRFSDMQTRIRLMSSRLEQ